MKTPEHSCTSCIVYFTALSHNRCNFYVVTWTVQVLERLWTNTHRQDRFYWLMREVTKEEKGLHKFVAENQCTLLLYELFMICKICHKASSKAPCLLEDEVLFDGLSSGGSDAAKRYSIFHGGLSDQNWHELLRRNPCATNAWHSPGMLITPVTLPLILVGWQATQKTGY